jgi:hypothetical protein
MPEKKTWWQSWIGLVVGLIAICSAILGALTWQYDTFATEEDVEHVDKKACNNVAQLSEKTLKGFEEVNKTNMQMQRSIRRFDLKDSHKQLLEQKYDLLQKLENNPDNQELKIDLDMCKSRIKMIEEELRELRMLK